VTRCQIYASCTAGDNLFRNNFQISRQERGLSEFWLNSYLFQATPVNRRLLVSLSTGANKEMQYSFHSVNGFQVSTDTTGDPLYGTTRCVSNGEGPGVGKGKYSTQEGERL
jgi:hypothetical protein